MVTLRAECSTHTAAWLQDMLFKMWTKSPENPINKAAAAG